MSSVLPLAAVCAAAGGIRLIINVSHQRVASLALLAFDL